MALESIMVKREGGRGFHRIDMDKYNANPSAYVICDENGSPLAGQPQGEQDQSGDLGTESGDQFSDEQLRGAIEAATGKAPHHKTGREKLISQFNELNAASAGE